MTCKKPYSPPAIVGKGSYLVVEGTINSQLDTTVIKLSRTVNVAGKGTYNPVSGAIVEVESDQNEKFPLTEVKNGKYIVVGLNLDNSHTYRLSIKTTGNEQYYSDYVPVDVTPPIDSVGYNIVTIPDTGLQVFVSTHNKNNASRYYRWDFTETWRFHAKYFTAYRSNGSAIVESQPDQWRYYCFNTDSSNNIILGSSAKLADNIISENEVNFISSKSEKVELEYSILLRQYSISADAYNFWAALKKNTESLGSIFDAQPSQITGNIHSANNPAEPVIGFVSVCTIQTKRIFINKNDLPGPWVPTYPYDCEIDSVGSGGIYFLIPLPNDLVPASKGGATYTTAVCADCSLRGNQTVPPFWK